MTVAVRTATAFDIDSVPKREMHDTYGDVENLLSLGCLVLDIEEMTKSSSLSAVITLLCCINFLGTGR